MTQNIKVAKSWKVPYLPFFDFGSNKGLCPLFQSPLFGVSSVVGPKVQCKSTARFLGYPVKDRHRTGGLGFLRKPYIKQGVIFLSTTPLSLFSEYLNYSRLWSKGLSDRLTNSIFSWRICFRMVLIGKIISALLSWYLLIYAPLNGNSYTKWKLSVSLLRPFLSSKICFFFQIFTLYRRNRPI